MNHHYQAGWRARRRGISVDSCPHSMATAARSWWIAGYYDYEFKPREEARKEGLSADLPYSVVANRLRNGTSMALPYHPRTIHGGYKAAREAGERHYEGSPCGKCGGTRKFTSNKTCAECGGTGKRRTPRGEAAQMTEHEIGLARALLRDGMSERQVALKFEVSRYWLNKFLDGEV